MSLEGRVVLITGGGQGIGEACARLFAAQGAKVAVAARSRDRIERVADGLRATGASAVAVTCDVSDSSQVAAMVAEVEQQLGPIDVLIANAGIAMSAPFGRTSDEQWQQVISINLSGTFFCMRAVIDKMAARGWGRIINVASDAGKVGFLYTGAYCASKHGIVGLTRTAALEVAKKGVTVNAICPGFVDTPMTDQSVSNIVGKTGRSEENARTFLEGLNPQGRLVTPEEVAAMALYLASDAARGVNGQSIPLDGGTVMS